MYTNYMPILVLIVSLCNVTNGYESGFAWVYPSNSNNFYKEVQSAGFSNVYLDSGSISASCRGIDGSSENSVCVWSPPPSPTADASIDQYNNESLEYYAEKGMKVYMEIGGNINGSVPEFSDMTDSEIQGMAESISIVACNQTYATGLMLDMEPYESNQNSFYKYLGEYMKSCGKYWATFVNAKTAEREFYNNLGSYGSMQIPGYDLSGKNCSCLEPSYYGTTLRQYISNIKSNKNYDTFYSVALTATGVSDMFQSYTGTKCSDKKPVYCGYSNVMVSYMEQAVSVLNDLCKDDEYFLGVGLYHYATGNNGYYEPSEPQSDVIKVLQDAGYIN